MVPDAPGSSTNIIHNEFLCFVTNKFSAVPFENLVKICTDF